MEHFLRVNGVIAAQTKKIEPAFNKILNKFSTIIEIGFDRGALSQWLHDNKQSNTKLVSYDISFNNKLIHNDDIDFRLGDCFDEKIIKEISALIQLPGKTLVLCDGGNKEREFEVYSSFLKIQDVIMLHDYAHSESDYKLIMDETGWKSPAESRFENIQHIIKTNNLKPYQYDTFKSVLWGSFTKSK